MSSKLFSLAPSFLDYKIIHTILECLNKSYHSRVPKYVDPDPCTSRDKNALSKSGYYDVTAGGSLVI